MLNIRSGSTDLGPSATAAPVAVATPAQAEVLAALTTSGPSTAAELASRMGQHTNTVREHLDALVALGLTARERESPAGRGRPAYRYAAVSASPEGAAYRVFLEALVEEFVATGPVERATERVTERATELGRRASLTPPRSEYAAPPSAPTAPSSAPLARTTSATRQRLSRALADAMDGLGFTTEELPRGRGLRLLTCPLIDVATRHAAVVCGFHQGMLQSVAARAGADPSTVALTPFAEPGACVVRLGPAARR